MQQKLGLDATTGSAEESLLIAWINEGVVDLLLRAKVNVNEATLTTTANVADYTIDTGVLAIQDLTYTSAAGAAQLKRVSPDDILRYRSATPAVGAGVRYYAINGSDMIMFYPTPTAVDTLTIWYVPRPTAMSSLSNTAHDPSGETYGNVPKEYHKAIELFALAEGAEFTDHQPSQFGQLFRAQYEQKLVEVKRAQRHKGGRYLGAATVGKRRPLVGANDVYPRL